MALLPNLAPMRWPSGPLEVSRGRKREGFTPQTEQALARWHDPAVLGILKNTPVNCLVISWAAGLPEDAGQQKTAAPLIAEARRLNLTVIGWVEGSADHNAAIAAARTAGLSALAIQGFKGKSDFTVIPWGDRANVPYDSAAPVLPVTGNVWPGIQPRQGGGAEAGPTGLPWLDSNGWYIQLARARTRSDVWVMFDPPTGRTVVQPQAYAMAVADAEAAGGRWVISLDPGLRLRLAGGDATASATWKGLLAAVDFFRKRREWRSYRPLGVVGVISDFSGGNFDMSGEILNLMTRLGTPLRPLWKRSAVTESFAGLRALVYADSEPAPKDLRQKVLTFVENGGLLVTGPKWGPEGKSLGPGAHLRFDVRALGKGRLALAKEELADPYQLSLDAQILLSHSNDLVRFFGTGSSVCYHYTGAPDQKRALLQLLTFAGGRGVSQLTIWMHRKYRAARLRSLQDPEPAALEPHASDAGGVEYQVPQMPAYGALELEV